MSPVKISFIVSLSLAFSPGLAVAAEDSTEALLKAAIVYNITRFVTWPESSPDGAGLTMCIQEDHQLVSAFSGFSAAQSQGQAFQMRLVESFEVLVEGCHIAFLSEADLEHVDLAAAAGQEILTVSDIPGFAESGGTLELQRVGRKIGFSINRLIEELSRVRLSSRILQLAERVL